MSLNNLIQVVTFLLFLKNGSLEETIPKGLLGQLFPPYTRINSPRHNIVNSSCQYQYHLSYYAIVGADCYNMPKNVSTSDTIVALFDTGMSSIQKNAFKTWSGIVELSLVFNTRLTDIQPGAFLALNKVISLSIQNNRNLTYLHPGSFQGLVNLKEVSLIRNNILNVKDVSPALTPLILPKLEFLDLSENPISTIEDDDFSPLINTSVSHLTLTNLKSYDIQRRALLPFKNLSYLDLGGNHLNSSVLSTLVSGMASAQIDIKHLGLRSNMLTEGTNTLFKAISSTGISFLDLSNVQFGRIGPGFFPFMPNIQGLNLSEVNIEDLPEGAIDNKIMPNLTTLILTHNLFSGVTQTMIIPTLKKLDLAENAGKLKNANFYIPPLIFSNMTHLEELILSKNDIDSLQKGTVSYIETLKYLWLSEAYIHTIQNFSFDENRNLIYLNVKGNDFGESSGVKKNIFAGLTNLLALDMSQCYINRLVPDVFSHLKNLKYLSLRGNRLPFIPPSIFKSSPNLSIIDLTSNSLTSWNENIFNNHKLSKVILNNNRLSTITPAMVQDLANVRTVEIYDNQINCNCELLNNIKTVFPETEFKSFSLFSAKSACYSSTEGGKISIEEYWNSVKNTKLCYVMSLQLKLGIGIGVTLLAIISAGTVYYYFKWEIIYWWYRIKQHLVWLTCKRHKDNSIEGEECKYDAFISYCHEDKKFVAKMVAILEGQFGFRLCLYERDFRVGDLISESVLENVAASRMTIMVLTNSFAKSQWCLWELHIAQQRLFYRSSTPDSLILIKLSDIDETIMSHTLRHLMNARIYLEWPKKFNKQKVFWQQLKSAIDRNK